QIEKGKPFFEKLSRNIYLRAIRDGFISAMPVILFSSIFLLIAYVPNIFGFKWDKGMEAILMKPYNYTMGLVAFLVAGTTAKSLTDSFNRKLESTNQINFISTMLAAMCGFLFLASDPAKDGGFLSAFMGTKGLLTAFLSAFVTVIVYNFCVKRNITIKMPKEVPPNISQVFKDLIPFSAVIIILYALDLVIRNSFKSNVAEGILKLFEPILFGAPLVLNPVFFIPFVLAPIVNVWIFKLFVEVLGMNSFSVNLPWTTPGPLGIIMGTGFGLWSFVLAITLIVVDIIIYYPFLKVYDSEILDEEEGRKESNSDLKEKVAANFDTKKADSILAASGVSDDAAKASNITEQTNVLVLCAGGGTSGLLANALNKAAEEYHVPVKAAAGGYGAHMDIMKEYQLIILAPQVASNYEDIKQDTDRLGIKLAKTQGAEYIKLTRDGQAALDFVQ
ncbi:PTS lactose transporter subunit IIBC, partial [Staphylococcus aureus]|nr:PTS lactose transporter subunit IIBC [Staphylococcus aureus]